MVPTRKHDSGRPLLIGPAIFGLMALGILLAAQQPHRHGLKRIPPAELDERSFVPAGFMPEVHQAWAEPSLPYASFARLAPVHVVNINSGEKIDVRIYDLRGQLDPEALEKLDRLLCDWGKPDDVKCAQVDRRAIQLMFRAAYHFGRGEIVIISGYREPRKRSEGLHAQARAIDFKLTGVRLAELSAYVRTFPRAGIGIYTHPKTQYVHVDSRERGYHWGDSSGPGTAGGEWSLGGLEVLARQDAAYSPLSDWPEGTRPPPEAKPPEFAPAEEQDEPPSP